MCWSVLFSLLRRIYFCGKSNVCCSYCLMHNCSTILLPAKTCRTAHPIPSSTHTSCPHGRIGTPRAQKHTTHTYATLSRRIRRACACRVVYLTHVFPLLHLLRSPSHVRLLYLSSYHPLYCPFSVGKDSTLRVWDLTAGKGALTVKQKGVWEAIVTRMCRICEQRV